MSEERALLAETVNRLFGDAFSRPESRTPPGGYDAALWEQVEDLGLPALLVPEASGGAGGAFADALAVVRAMGRFAISLPLAETLLAARLLAAAGLERPEGPLSVAVRVQGSLRADGRLWRFRGKLAGIPWGAQAAGIVAVLASESGPRLALLPPAAAAAVERRSNLADEPRDRMRFSDAPVATTAVDEGASARLFDGAALLRTGQIAGALAAALERSIDHARERVQFGRPISQFQAVQQQLARMGSEVAAVDCAATAAFRAADHGDAGFEIACARLRANLAIEVGVATAHQIHGAIGFTHECDLRLFTQRLLCWRSELGNDLYWAGRLGRTVAARGPDAFWADLTARADALWVDGDGAETVGGGVG